MVIPTIIIGCHSNFPRDEYLRSCRRQFRPQVILQHLDTDEGDVNRVHWCKESVKIQDMKTKIRWNIAFQHLIP